jgi:hypothetical protein
MLGKIITLLENPPGCNFLPEIQIPISISIMMTMNIKMINCAGKNLILSPDKK